MPSPIETLLRVQDSPVPTQTFVGCEGSTAIAPIDCTGSSSNTGLNVVAPSVDFHTPPLAAPTKRVILPRRIGIARECRDAPAHGGRSHVAGAEAGDRSCIEDGDVVLRESRQVESQEKCAARGRLFNSHRFLSRGYLPDAALSRAAGK